MSVPKHLLGTHLEGGGQIIRNSLVLCSLLLQPLTITKIRGGRPNGGGLKSQHLAGVNWLSRATGSPTAGAEKGSRTLRFLPGAHVRDGVVVDVDIGTPGSITLLLQAILPYLLFRGGEEGVLEVVVHGGTNVEHSPSVDYFQHVLFPMLNRWVLRRQPELAMVVERRCWGSAKELGLVRFSVPVLRRGERIAAFEMVGRGGVAKIFARMVVPEKEQEAFRRCLDAALRREDWASGPVEIEIAPNEDSGGGKKLYLMLVAHTVGGFRLAVDVKYDSGEHRRSARGLPREVFMVEKCIRQLKRELDHGGCADEFLQDQLVVFQALAEGLSRVDIGRTEEEGMVGGSLHTRTANWVVEELCGKKYETVDGMMSVEGIGYANE